MGGWTIGDAEDRLQRLSDELDKIGSEILELEDKLDYLYDLQNETTADYERQLDVIENWEELEGDEE